MSTILLFTSLIIPKFTSAALTTGMRRKILDEHNDLRSQAALGQASCGCSSDSNCDSSTHPYATNMNEVEWSYNLERFAQDYADACVYEHSDSTTRQTTIASYSDDAEYGTSYEGWIGENLAVASSDSVVWNNYINGVDYGVEGCIDRWFDESSDYNSESQSSCDGATGHYTQVVWADTRYIGCGAAYCSGGVTDSSGNVLSSYYTLYLVCNYASGGNYDGQDPYEMTTRKAKVASNCDADRTADSSTGLCGGPQKADWYSSGSAGSGSKTVSNGWVCYDGTGGSKGSGRSLGCEDATPTDEPTAAPVSASGSTGSSSSSSSSSGDCVQITMSPWSGLWSPTGDTYNDYPIYSKGSYYMYIYPGSNAYYWFISSTSSGWDTSIGFCSVSPADDLVSCAGSFCLYDDDGSCWIQSSSSFEWASCDSSGFTVSGGCFDDVDVDAVCVYNNDEELYRFNKLLDDDDCTYKASISSETYYLHHTIYAEWMISLDTISRDSAIFTCYDDNLLNCTSAGWTVSYISSDVNATIPSILANTNTDFTVGICSSHAREDDDDDESNVVDIVIAVVVLVVLAIFCFGLYLYYRSKPTKHVAFNHSDDGNDTQMVSQKTEPEEVDDPNAEIEVEVPIQTNN